MAFWSGEKLECLGPALISRPEGGFDPSAIDCNAITLHLGDQYYRTADAYTEKKIQKSVQETERGKWFTIPSGQFAFLITRETVTVPKDAMAFISMKSRTKWEGLINISGFHVDPGYSGKLIFSVLNAGPSPIHLQAGMPLFLIWYANLDRESAKVKKPDTGIKEISKDLIKGMNSPVLSLRSLSDEITKLRNQMKVQTILFAYGVSVVTAIVVGLIIYAARSSMDPPTEGPTAQIVDEIGIEKSTIPGDQPSQSDLDR